MNSDEFDAHFIDVPRLTAEEITAFLAAWTLVGPVLGPETHEDTPVDELVLITLLAAGHTECAPPERGDMRRRLSARIEQTARGALRTDATKRKDRS